MDNTQSKWWWLPSALMALTGILFLVAATYRNAAVWLTIGVIFLLIAGMNFRRRRASARPNSD